MSEIEKKLDSLISLTGQLVSENQSFHERLAKIEETPSPNEKNVDSSGRSEHVTGTLPVGDNTGAAVAEATALPKDCANIQQEFLVIRDAIQRVKLPNDLKLDESSPGVQNKDRPRRNVLARCAKYAETSLKLLSTLKAGQVSEGDLQDLITISMAQVRYLQEEQAMILVNNNFGEVVEKTYRNFRRNT